jgi:hypothetical protein
VSQQWTDQTERLVIDALLGLIVDNYRESQLAYLAAQRRARAVLAALFSGDLLIPPGSEVEVQRSIRGEDEGGPWIVYVHAEDWPQHQDGKRCTRTEITTPWREAGNG